MATDAPYLFGLLLLALATLVARTAAKNNGQLRALGGVLGASPPLWRSIGLTFDRKSESTKARSRSRCGRPKGHPSYRHHCAPQTCKPHASCRSAANPPTVGDGRHSSATTAELEQLDAVRAGVREAIQALNDECKRLSERRDGLNDSIRQKTQELQTAVDHHTAHSKKLEDLLVEHTASIATNKKELEECRVDTENVLTAAKRTITDSPEWTSGQVSVAVAALAHKFDKHVARLGAEMPYDLGNNPDLLEHFDAAYVELQTTFARIEHHHKQTVHNLEARLDEANEHIAAKHDIHERTIRELEDANINLSDETAKTERFDAQVDYWKQKYADLLARDPESARDHTSAVDEIEQLRFELGEKDGIIKFQSGMMAQFHQERTLSVDSLAQIGEAVENKARQLDESTDDSEQKGHPLTGQSGNAEHPDRERDGMMRFIEATGKEISELRDQLWDQYDKTAPAMPTAGDLVARLRSITRENRELREDYHQLLKSVDFNHQLSDVYKAIPRQSGGDLGTPSPTSFSLGSGRSLSPLDTHSPDKIVETVVDAVAPHLDRLKSTHAESRDECRALRWENEELRRRIADLEGTCLRYARDNSLLQNKIAQMVASTHSPSLGEGHATPEYSPSTDSAGGETGDVKKLEATIAQLHVEIGYWRAHKQPGFRNVPRISVSSGEGPPTRQPAGDTKPSWMILREQMHEELKKGVTNNRSDGSDVLPSPYESDGLAPSRSGSSGSGRAGSSSPHVWERKATVWPLPGLPTRSPTWPQRLGRGNEDSEGSVASTGSAVSPRQKVPRSNRDPHGAFNLLSRSAQPSASMPQPLNIVKARAESLKQEYVGFSAEDASEFEVLSSALVEAVGPEIVPVARQLLPGLKGKFEYLQQKIWALQGTIADMRNAEKEVYSLTSRASLAAAAALETKLTILEARLQASEKARRELALVPLGSSVNAARFQLPEPTNVEQLMQQNQQLTQQAWELTQQNHALTHENQAFLDTCQRLGAAIEDRDLVLFRQKTNLNEEEYQNRQSFLKAYLRALREVSRMELEHIWLMDRVLVLEGNRSEFRLEDYQNLANRRAGLLNRIAELRDLVSQNRGTSMAAAWTQQIDACNDELDMASAEMAPLHEQFRLLTGQQCNYDESIIRDINGRGAEMIGVPDPLARSAMEKLGNHVFSICQDLQDLGSQPNASDAFAMISAFGGGYEDPVTRRMCYQHLIWSMLVELVFEGCLWAGSVRAEARAILAFLSDSKPRNQIGHEDYTLHKMRLATMVTAWITGKQRSSIKEEINLVVHQIVQRLVSLVNPAPRFPDSNALSDALLPSLRQLVTLANDMSCIMARSRPLWRLRMDHGEHMSETLQGDGRIRSVKRLDMDAQDVANDAGNSVGHQGAVPVWPVLERAGTNRGTDGDTTVYVYQGGVILL